MPRNWAGNHEYRARSVLRPRSVPELQEMVRASRAIRALGSRHSFNDLADTSGDLVSLEGLPRVVEMDAAAGLMRVDGAARYGDLGGPLHAAGFALPNLASLPHISVAGACATGTHGSGDRRQILGASVRALEVVRADGELVRVGGGRADTSGGPIEGAVVSLGALGIVTSLTLAIEPTYLVRQWVFEGLTEEAFAGHFDELSAAGDHVSFFTTWESGFHQVWVKERVTADSEASHGAARAGLFGAAPATHELHPIPGGSPEACTPQLGVPGPWHERIPHFRLEFTPSRGDEIQSEYFVARRDAVAAFESLRPLRDRIAPLLWVSEIRTIAADGFWLSPAYGRDSVAIHFTWKLDWPSVRALLPSIEAALEPFAPRPHWGKLFTLPGEQVRAAYERLDDFASVAAAFDPEGKFSNEFLTRFVLKPDGFRPELT